MDKVLVLLSGGIDSTTALYDSVKKYSEVTAVSFNYGSKHNKRELIFAAHHCKTLDVRHEIIDLPFMNTLFKSDLLKSGGEIPDGHYKEDSMKRTVVPFRNGIFLSIATAIAEKEGASALFIGVVQEDSSGYPDCTDSFIDKMQNAMNQGTKEETKLDILTPLVHLSKAQIVQKSIDLNVPLHLTWSCYANEDKACGVCDSCRLRLNGFKVANQTDKIEYETL